MFCEGEFVSNAAVDETVIVENTRHCVAGMKLLRSRQSSDHRPALDDHHLPAGSGQQSCGCQAVVSAADDDGIK